MFARKIYILFIGIFIAPAVAGAAILPLNMIKLPPGFKIDLYAVQIPNARSMARGDNGTIFVGTRVGGVDGKVYALVDQDGDFRADRVVTLVQGMSAPNGVAFHNGDLYVAEIHRVWKFEDAENNLTEPKPVMVRDDFPRNTHHGWKYIKFGPDGKLYIPVGAPCNVCVEEDDRFGSMMRMNSDGSELAIYAKGIRNTVGFDWDPRTGELWFTDNGRDLLGDNLPPDELNHAPKAGMNFGFPYCHGKEIQDPEFTQKSCDEFTPAAFELGPHVAALGMKFYTGEMFPEEYKNRIFIAEHGSWNRTNKIGYRVSMVYFDDDGGSHYEPFATGWQVGESAWGRPVDILQLPDGSLLVSDDRQGVIYRITYSVPNSP